MITQTLNVTGLQSGWSLARRIVIGAASEVCTKAWLFSDCDSDSSLSRTDG
jgi:hypothetical protein